MIGIYKITNLINGKHYIGQSIHIERRWVEHCIPSSRSLIGKAIRKYGKEQFSFQVLEECSQDQLNEKEEYYIKQFNSVVPNGYNIMDWVEGQATCFNIDKDTLMELFNDIKSTDLTFEQIANKFDLSVRTIIRINQGHTHYSNELSYPLRYREPEEENYCIDCGCMISKKAVRCKSCYDKYQRTTDRPSREELKNLIRTTPFTQLGKKFGVSDNAVRKWCKAYGLPTKSTEIKKIPNEEWQQI